LKQKVSKFQKQLNESDRDRGCLEKQLEVVKTENVKFISDIKIMKNEHSEIMHTMSKIERKIDQLERENMYFKSVIEAREVETYTNDRGATLSEEPDEVSEYEMKNYIGDSYPKNHDSSETRIMQFNPSGLDRCDTSDNAQNSSKLQKRRFLIPKPGSTLTAKFKSTEP
jgi:septal ring factor EnvC (AmiA/AmiB activator)